MTDIPDSLRALVRRSVAAPEAERLVTEVRTEGAPHFKAEPSASLETA